LEKPVMDVSKQEELLERIETLERKVLRLRASNLAALAGIAAILVSMIVASRPSDTIATRSLVLEDQWGNTRAKLGLSQDGSPQLAFHDIHGNKLVSVAQTYADSSALTFFDRGEPRIQLSSNSQGMSTLRFLDEGRESQTSLFMARDRSMGVSLVSADQGMFFGLQADGSPGLRIVDATGKEQGRISLSAEDLRRICLNQDAPKRSTVEASTRTGDATDASFDSRSSTAGGATGWRSLSP
jgi:hypothetical protein